MTIMDVIERIKRNDSPYKLHVESAASEVLITSVESTLSLQLPNDFKDFYRFCNGLEILQDMFRILPMQDIIDRWNIREYKPNHFYISEYLIYSDFWQVGLTDNQSGYTIYTSENAPLTTSLPEYIDLMLSNSISGMQELLEKNINKQY